MMFNAIERKVPEEKIDWEAKVKMQFPFDWPFCLAVLQTAEKIVNVKPLDQDINWEKVYQVCKLPRGHIFSVLYNPEQVRRINQCYQQFIQGCPQALDKICYFDNSNQSLSLSQLLERLKNADCKLKSLCLDYNLKESEAKAIAAALMNPNCKLLSLGLDSNRIGDKGVEQIAISLVNPNCKLSSLSLSFNWIKDNMAKEIAIALINPNCKLTSLNLFDNQIGYEGTKALAVALMNPNCKLISLNLGYNHSGDVEAEEIAVALRSPDCTLSFLYQNYNQIGYIGAKKIAAALSSSNGTLSSLHLSYNQIGDGGAKEIALALRSPNCRLLSLDLSSNRIGDEGAKEIAISLLNPNCKLSSLSLSFNWIGDKGANEMAIALRNPNCKLTSLDLYHNQIEDKGVKETVNALVSPNCKLTLLALGYNEIGKFGAQAIALAQKKNHCFCDFPIDLNSEVQEYIADFDHQWRRAQKVYTLFSHPDKNSQHLSVLPPLVTVYCLFPYLYDIFKDELKEHSELRAIPVMKYVTEIIEGKTIKKEKWILVKGEVSTGKFVYPQSQTGNIFLENNDRHFADVMPPSHLVPGQKNCLIS